MKWTTRDGRQIEIRDMTDAHLLNTITYLRRPGSRRGIRRINRMRIYSATMISRAYRALLDEANRRRMRLPPYCGDPTGAAATPSTLRSWNWEKGWEG